MKNEQGNYNFGYGVIISKEDHAKMHSLTLDKEKEDAIPELHGRSFSSENVRDAIYFDILVSEGLYNVPETISNSDLDRAIARLNALSNYKRDVLLWEHSKEMKEEYEKEIDIVDAKLAELRALRDKRKGKKLEHPKSNHATIAILEEIKSKFTPFMEYKEENNSKTK